MARRYLVRLENEKGHLPSDWRTVRISADDAVRGFEVRVGAIRIGTRVIGLHLFIEKEEQLDQIFERLGSALGKVIEHRALDVEHEAKPKEQILEEAKALFNEERYWECHEILERVSSMPGGVEIGSPEAKLFQGLVLVAAAFIHYQRASQQIALSVLQRSLRKLEAWTEDSYMSLDVKSLKENIQRIINSNEISPFQLN